MAAREDGLALLRAGDAAGAARKAGLEDFVLSGATHGPAAGIPAFALDGGAMTAAGAPPGPERTVPMAGPAPFAPPTPPPWPGAAPGELYGPETGPYGGTA